MKFLDKNITKIGLEVSDAQEAIKAAGGLLLRENLIEETYIEAMVKSYQDNGPYFVIAPHIALPHARPEDGVREASVSLVQLKKPVVFGHVSNDPVQLVFGLGASTSEEHLALLRRLTSLLNDPLNIEVLLNAKCYDDIKIILEKE